MPSPFPGLDPYLEPHWGDVNTSLAVYACEQLQPQLIPRDLCARIEEYEGPPLHSRSERPTLREIRIKDPHTEQVFTVMEILNPANKCHPAGKKAYRRKRQDYLDSDLSVVEIDLMREGNSPLIALLIPRAVAVLPECRGPAVRVVRACKPKQIEVYPVSIRTRLAVFRVPVRELEADAVLNLQPLFDRCYRNGGYDSTDYARDPEPPLSEEDAKWADALLRKKGKRS